MNRIYCFLLLAFASVALHGANIPFPNQKFGDGSVPVPPAYQLVTQPTILDFQAEFSYRRVFSNTCGIWRPSTVAFDPDQIPPKFCGFAAYVDGLKTVDSVDVVPPSKGRYRVTAEVGSRKDGFGAASIFIQFYLNEQLVAEGEAAITQGSGKFETVVVEYVIADEDVGQELVIGFRAPNAGALQVAVSEWKLDHIPGGGS